MKNFRPVPYNEGPMDWQSLFAIPRICFIKVLFQPFYYCWGKENRLLYTEDFVVYRGSTVLNQDIDPGGGGGGGGALGYFLGGYVPPGTPNWHPVLKFKPKLIV